MYTLQCLSPDVYRRKFGSKLFMIRNIRPQENLIERTLHKLDTIGTVVYLSKKETLNLILSFLWTLT